MKAFEVSVPIIVLTLVLGWLAGCGKTSEPPPFNPGPRGYAGSGGIPDTTEPSSAGGQGGTAGLAGASGAPVEPEAGTGEPSGGTGASGDALAGTGTGDSGSGGIGVISDPVVTAGTGGGRVFDAGSDADRNRVEPGRVCERLSTIQCAGEAYCCDNPGRDLATCKQIMFEGCTRELMLDAVSLDPVVDYDLDRAEDAFTEYERMTSECNTSVADWAISLDGMRSIIKGSKEPEEDCSPDALVPTDEDNAAGLASCKYPETHACLPVAALVWRCKPLSDAGGDCITDVNCKSELYCDNPSLTYNRDATCKVRKPVGEACDLPNECETLMCKRGSCVPADKQAVFCLQDA